MISLPNPTQSPTLELSTEQRERLVDFIADRYLDSMNLRDLENFFYEIQADLLADYSDGELLGALEDVTDDDEYQRLLNETV